MRIVESRGLKKKPSAPTSVGFREIWESEGSAYYLYRAGSYFRTEFIALYQVLEIARVFGWSPHGTQPSPNRPRPNQLWPSKGYTRPWDGQYLPRKHQVVSISDAQNLAAALERALLANAEELIAFITAHQCDCNKREGGAIAQPIELLQIEDWRIHIRQFISFCRAGSFQIG